MEEQTFPNPIQVPLDTAKEWEKRYEDDITVEDPKNKVKCYLIPRESLELVLQLNADAVRAYIGINDLGEKTLLFVGAKFDNETNQYIDVYGPPVNQQNKAAAEEVVYDGARSCPPY